MNKLYLIDGMSLVFRAYHAMSRSGLKSPSGEPSFAVFAFVNIITSLLEKEKPEHIAVVFDTATPTFRHELYPEYKANRDAFPEELVPQLARIKEFLDYISIPRVELPGYEADDIIGTLSHNASNNEMNVVCLTSDKDYYQLVNDYVRLYKPAKQSNEDFDIVGLDEVKEKFGGTPSQVIDVLALIGDTSDNVPGVKGVGEKTAIPLIQKFGSLENLYEHVEQVDKESVKSKLIEDKDKAFLAKTLVTIKLDVPLDITYDELVRKTPDYQKLDNFFASLGFNTIRKKWHDKSVEDSLNKKDVVLDKSGKEEPDISFEPVELEKEIEAGNKVKTLNDIPHTYILADNEKILDEMLTEISGRQLLSIDLETSSLDKNTCRITGISLCVDEGKAWYIPVYGSIFQNQPEPVQKNDFSLDSLFYQEEKKEKISTTFQEQPEKKEGYLATALVLEKLKPILENKSVGKCGQNIKFDAYILKRHGVEVSPIVFDSMLASYLLNPDVQHNLDALSLKWLNYEPIPITVLIGEKKSQQLNMEDIEPARIKDYACEDADCALKLRNIFYPELKKENLLKLAEEIEFPLVEVLIRMESNGVAIDTSSLSEISVLIDINSKELTNKIYSEAGEIFNIDSPKQLSFILFEKMRIPVISKNKTGNSTNVQVLMQLADIYPIASMILDYRQLTKLKSTYVDVLPKLIHPITGRIHTNFNQTIASTGRLSSTDPNLQNIPIRTSLGKEIRKAFVPQGKDRLILSADYSQIELRIMAHISKDPNLINAFKEGKDIHASTAAILYDIPIDKVDSDMRRVAKTVNFGIMYGLGSFGLSQRLGLGRRESQAIIDNYFRKYPGIKRYIDMTIKSTRDKGYAETILGRRRYFTNINSKNHNLRAADERAAINMPIQGTASDMLKLAMLKIDKEMLSRKMKSMMTIQVHDELVFEAFNDELEVLKKLVVESMESALPLGDVPVVADVGVGENWFLAH